MMLKKPQQVLRHGMKILSMAPIALGLCYGICVEHIYTSKTSETTVESALDKNGILIKSKEATAFMDKEEKSSIEKAEDVAIIEETILNEEVRSFPMPVPTLEKQGVSRLEMTTKADSTKLPATKVKTDEKSVDTSWLDGGKKPSSPKVGACYAKCMIPESLRKVKANYPIYTGDGKDGVATEEIEIQKTAARSKWVKKKSSKNCMSADPKDCLVWCLVDVPAKSEKIVVVKDPSSTDKFKMEEVQMEMMVKPSQSDWQEVVCADKMTKVLVSKIQEKLNAEGADLEVNGIADQATKKALTAYQNKLNLPSGGFTITSLKALKIKV